MILQEGIRLYHGSYTIVERPDLSKCRREKDFGRGFYVTTDEGQAERFVKSSVSKAVKENLIGRDTRKGYVSEFLLKCSSIDIRCFEFNAVDQEWLHCVVSHRRPSLMPEEYNKWKPYDIIAGKIANDNTNPTINFYISGAYGPVGSKNAVSMAIEILKPFRLKNQVCFRTDRAMECLSYQSYEEITW